MSRQRARLMIATAVLLMMATGFAGEALFGSDSRRQTAVDLILAGVSLIAAWFACRSLKRW